MLAAPEPPRLVAEIWPVSVWVLVRASVARVREVLLDELGNAVAAKRSTGSKV